MAERLTQQRRVEDEGFRVVNSFSGGRGRTALLERRRTRATAAGVLRRRRRPRRRRRRKVIGTTSAPDRLLGRALPPSGRRRPDDDARNRKAPCDVRQRGGIPHRLILLTRVDDPRRATATSRTRRALRPVDGDVRIDSTSSLQREQGLPASVMMRLARDARDAPRKRRRRMRRLETARDRGDEGDTGATRPPNSPHGQVGERRGGGTRRSGDRRDGHGAAEAVRPSIVRSGHPPDQRERKDLEGDTEAQGRVGPGCVGNGASGYGLATEQSLEVEHRRGRRAEGR